ncbi:RAB11-binding protein RELCH homolog [Oratosquilla oratoria]|uniref:RAB11-binding protein RELCH homolog n=1 Tax=Oratosquilla oratoria TaxID=337810 RepID=UPI003F76890C
MTNRLVSVIMADDPDRTNPFASGNIEKPKTQQNVRRDTSPKLNWDDVAHKLLQENLLLTALELHSELVESGRELPRLRDYFSNPAHFEKYAAKPPDSSLAQLSGNLIRSSSQTTLDSLDWGRYSEDGERATDERIAVLEFELRKARETIQSLRANLTQATELEGTAPDQGGTEGSTADHTTTVLRPHEKRTLNFLINEYLVTNSYKLTAITFADENDDQDFEHWDDVGLNVPRPADLVKMYRDSGFSVCVDMGSVGCQTESMENDALITMENMNAVLQARITELENETEELKNKCSEQEKQLEQIKSKTSTPNVTPFTTPMKKLDTPSGCNTQDNNFSPGHGRESPEGISDTEETPVSNLPCIDNQRVYGEAEDPATSVGDPADAVSEVHVADKDFSVHDDTEKREEDSIEDMIRASSTEVLASDTVQINPSIQSDTNCDSKCDTIKTNQNDQTESLDNVSDQTDIPTLSSDGNDIGSNVDNDLYEREETLYKGAPLKDMEALREEARDLLRASSKRQVNAKFEAAILELCHQQPTVANSRLQTQVETLAQTPEQLVHVLCKSLHNIVPNVILAKREELLPLLVYGVSLHEDPEEREKLLHLLFNLIKRPDEQQRHAILTGLVGLARVLGAAKLEAELLPQCWEQLTHKYTERRLLVAQSTAALAPYTPAPLRNSLLLSMLHQLLGPGGEKEPSVRESALTSLALIVTYLDDLDKLPSVMDTVMECLEEPSSQSHDATSASFSAVHHLLPAVAMWALEGNVLYQVLEPLTKYILQHTLLLPQDGQSNMKTDHHLITLTLMEALIAVGPFIIANLIKTCPPTEGETGQESVNFVSLPAAACALEELDVILGDREEAEKGLARFYHYVSKEWYKKWPELQYITENFIPALVEVLVPVSAAENDIVHGFVKLFSKLSSLLGPQITETQIVPLFLKHLDVSDSALDSVSNGQTGLTRAMVVVYAGSFLTTNQLSSGSEELEKFLSRQISILSLCHAPQEALFTTLTVLLPLPHTHEAILGALWSGVVHKSPLVRICSAALWGLVITGIEEAVLGNRVIPALVTLATDPDPSVRASAIQPLASVLSVTSKKEVVDKVELQLESVCEEGILLQTPPLQLALAKTCTALAHSSSHTLLYKFFLPRLCKLALENRSGEEVWVAMLEAYSSLTCCDPPPHVIAHFVLPPLTQLQKILGPITFEHMETITQLIKEFSRRAQASQADRKKTPGISTSTLVTPVGVDEMRNKMTKMFSTRTNATAQAINVNLPNFFKKK